ncbi:MAG: transcription termination/antitermination protein NusG [Mycoplasmataceae bacterium]|nr:transcription termination/antitermination protein NusG [Mycoplasmataceae bacterium]
MSGNFLNTAQWFIISAIAGKEKSIAENIKERIYTYGYQDLVESLQVIKKSKTETETFTKNDSALPKTLTNTKLTKWEVLPNGDYKKTSLKVSNKFPGYIFIKMVYNQDVWFVIRNTQGVLGFVGSSGKGAKPIPVSPIQYQNSLKTVAEETVTVEEYFKNAKPEITSEIVNLTNVTNYYVGDLVEIVGGKFASHTGVIKTINNDFKVAEVEITTDEGKTNFEVPFAELSK